MKNRHTVLGAIVAAVFPFAAQAQDFNPTVEVTNVYDVTMVDATKPEIGMAVPDSLLRFDLDFDYSVLSSPYQGGYDFSPYFLQMRPSPEGPRGNRFHLRAGAGYPLDPQLNLVWSPRLSKPGMSLDVYADFDSYFGRYSDMRRDSSYVGRDLQADAGAIFSKDWESTAMRLGLEYEGIHASDRFFDSGYNAVGVDARFCRKDDGSNNFQYAAGVKYRYAADKADYGRMPLGPEGLPESGVRLSMNELSLYGTLGKVFDGYHRVLVDLGLDMDVMAAPMIDNMVQQSGLITLVPKYVYGNGRMNLSAGVRINARTSSRAVLCGAELQARPGQIFYPDVHFDWQLIPGSMDLYASATGGLRHHSYSDLKHRSHFLNVASAFPGLPFIDNSSDRVDLGVGMRGTIAEIFRYDLSAGFLSAAGMLTDMYSSSPGLAYSGFVFQDRNVFRADLDLGLHTESVLFDGSVSYRTSDHFAKERLGFEDSPLSWDFRFRYDWNDRIFAGLHGSGSLARRGYGYVDSEPVEMRLPGWFDLGIDAEFALTRKFSMWLRAGNLLCGTLLTAPDHGRRGVNITAGICLNL